MSSPFLKACAREMTPYTPVWLMRQAGRYMEEYRKIRSKVGFLELCKNPDLASEVTVVAAKRLGVDAAIIFADILLIAEPMGFELTFENGEGPAIHNPFRAPSDLARLQEVDVKDSLSFVLKAISLTRSELGDSLPVIGFAGAPFTLASYLIEGGSSRHLERTKTLMRSEGATWNQFMDHLARQTSQYLKAQVEAGAQAVQLFDTWAGHLSPLEYRRFVLPHVQTIFRAIPKDIPKIYFGTDTATLLPEISQTGATVVGIDFRIPLERAWSQLSHFAVQGNLDPSILLSPPEVIERETKELLHSVAGRPGHIFNLGHGVLPQTPVEHVRRLVDYVHELSQR